ncbi:hypothetical protein G1H11_16355 [Phytoactinopolyspora alkaliphila]|uniref:Phosphodiesterase n=1 Tax=Phytoactinopolyspora alkaliphila TaxID=1783498 RepID=A0A6N9YPX4_9ACTN|nr:hypothetical protein [Phytoactinopolyspora alkaliphila]
MRRAPGTQDFAVQAAKAAGSLLGATFGAAGALRRNKPLHPKGLVYDALIRRVGSPIMWGCPWLDDEGTDAGAARLSRAIGLPAPVPDIHGLAITFTGDDGERNDLLLATTGLGRWGRFLLIPRSDPHTCSYGSLFPYRSSRDLVLLAAVPLPAFRPQEPPAVRFRLQAAGVAGHWHAFGTLELSTPEGGLTDRPLRFNPVAYPLPGLRTPRALQRLREPAYIAARRTPARVGPR